MKYLIPVIVLVAGCETQTEVTTPPPENLSLNSFEETIRWLDGELARMDTVVRAEQQLLGQKDKLAKKAEELRSKLAKYSGEKVNWRFSTFADEGKVTLRDTWVSQDGSKSVEDPGVILLIVNSTEQQISDGVYPSIAGLELSIPEQISRDEAIHLPLKVDVHATISEVRLEEARILPGGIHLELRVILDDITLVK
jgi:hypothetical protein